MKAQELELVRNATFASGAAVGSARKEDRLSLAANLYLKLGIFYIFFFYSLLFCFFLPFFLLLFLSLVELSFYSFLFFFFNFVFFFHFIIKSFCHYSFSLTVMIINNKLIGHLEKYCEILTELGQWEKALAVAPSVSIQFWRELSNRYADHLANSESGLSEAFLVATGNIPKVLIIH